MTELSIHPTAAVTIFTAVLQEKKDEDEDEDASLIKPSL